jgi:DNA primase
MLAVLGAPTTKYLQKGTPEEIAREWAKVTGETTAAKGDKHVVNPTLLHAVYSNLLKLVEVEKSHRLWLEERGCDAGLIKQAGYTTWPPTEKRLETIREKYGDKLLKVPGFVKRDNQIVLTLGPLAGIAFPTRDKEGRIAAIKVRYPRRLTDKYKLLTSARDGGPGGQVLVHWPMGCHHQAKVYGAVRIVEGERKADIAFWKTGYPTIGIPGVGTTKIVQETLRAIPEIKQVRLAMDRDEPGKKANVALAFALVDQVEIACERWDDAHKGFDDCLIAGAEREVINDDSWLED